MDGAEPSSTVAALSSTDNMASAAASLFGCAILPLVAVILTFVTEDSSCEPRPQTLS